MAILNKCMVINKITKDLILNKVIKEFKMFTLLNKTLIKNRCNGNNNQNFNNNLIKLNFSHNKNHND